MSAARPFVISMWLVASASVAHANWRDRCPVAPEPEAGSDEHVRVAENYGTSPELDTALGRDRAVVASRGAYFVSRGVHARTRMHTAIAHVAVNSKDGGAVSGGASVTLAFANTSAEPTLQPSDEINEHRSDFGSVVVNLWIRKSWLGAGWRNGRALRLVIGAPSLLHFNDRALRDEYAARSPFEPQLFSEGAGFFYERRGEMRGCYGLFFHLRLGGFLHLERDRMETETRVGRRVYTSLMPSVATGFHVSDRVTTYLQWGFQVDAPYNSIATSSIQRYRVGLEWSNASLALGGHVDLMLGSFDGVFSGIDASYRF